MALKSLPQNATAEIALIGCALIDNSVYDDVSDMVCASDFCSVKNKNMWSAIAHMVENGDHVDEITLANRLKLNGDSSTVSLSDIAEASCSVSTTSGAKQYAKIIHDLSRKRSIVIAAKTIYESGLSDDVDPVFYVDKSESDFFLATEQKESCTLSRAGDLVLSSISRLEKKYQTKDAITGLETGFLDLDFMLKGLQQSELILLAARPSQGKTACALNIAAHVAMASKKTVAFFSLEMAKGQIMDRLIGSLARVNVFNMRGVDDSGWLSISRHAEKIHRANLFIDDKSMQTVASIRSACRKLKREHGLDLVVVDYLQLMKNPGTKDRVNEVGEIGQGLKSIAKEFEVPVLALAQLNRAVESRQNKRPMLSDLRESGTLEQDADVVTFIYRDEYYLERDGAPIPDEKKGIAELIISKHRNGPIGTVNLGFEKEHTRFYNLYSGAI